MFKMEKEQQLINEIVLQVHCNLLSQDFETCLRF